MPSFLSNLLTRSRSSSRASRYNPDLDHDGKSDNRFLGVSSPHRSRSVSPAGSVSAPSNWSSDLKLDDAPPPYRAVHSSKPTSSSARSQKRSNSAYYRTPLRKESMDDAIEILRKFDIVILVDDSSSMKGELWTEAGEALATIANMSNEFDKDGIDIYFLNSLQEGHNLKTSEDVQELFECVRPFGPTPLGKKLDELFRNYLKKLETTKHTKNVKPVNYIVITDGRPTDRPASAIVNAARRLDSGKFPLAQLGVQIVQIGEQKEATEFLRQLDDELQDRYKIRDIVDTTPYFGTLSSDALIKIMLGGINRKIDSLDSAAL